jgi:hypothetical protein
MLEILSIVPLTFLEFYIVTLKLFSGNRVNVPWDIFLQFSNCERVWSMNFKLFALQLTVNESYTG